MLVCALRVVVDTVAQRTGIEYALTAGMKSAFGLGVGIVDTYTTGNVNPRQDIVFQTAHQHVTLTLGRRNHVVGNEVRVLHLHTLITVRPILCSQLARSVVTLVELHGRPVVTAWEKINRGQRVIVFTRTIHVLGVLNDVATTEIEVQLVVQEVARIASREVITIIFVVLQNTGGIRCRYRDKGLVGLCTRCQRKRVDIAVTCLEEILRVKG